MAKPRYLLGTTYTLSLAFFESAVFPNIGRDTLRKAVILSDQFGFSRAIDEAPALGGAGQDYVVESISTDRCLHAKVWFVIGDSDFVLLVGSGNLTQSGFMTNAELFETLRFSESDRMPQQTYSSIKSFLNGLVASVADPSGIAAQAVSEIATELERFASDKDLTNADPVFIHSFDQPIIDQLPVGGVSELEIAAPFFGAGLAGIRLLANRFSHDHVKVFPAVHNGNEIDLPTRELQKAFPKSTAARLHDQFKPGAFQHLKLYGAKAVDQSWLFCTSANCTVAALKGRNIEAGILRRVPPETVETYFGAAVTPLPQQPLSRKSDDDDSTSRFIFSATDSGNSIVIHVSDRARQSLPLGNVVVTVRSGNSISAVALSTMCESGQSQTISWSAFPAWQQPRKRTIRVDVAGVGKSGAAVRGSAFIGNYLLLSSEPGHRSAWRAAIAILDSEGVPELADISALFTLANEVLDLPSAPASLSSRALNERPEPSGDLIPIWPPTADMQKLQQRFGRAAGGQLKWFQEILSTFLRRGREEERPESQSRAHDQEDEGDDDDDSSISEAQRLKRQEQDADIATRLWNRAKQEYDSLLSKLHEHEPTIENAANVWPVAIFTFLAVMGLVASAIRKTPKPEWKLEVNFLIDDFIRTMFQHRQQSGDYWPPASSRYRNDDFPALARDLKQNFHYHMHHLLGPIVIALFADQMMRQRPSEFRPKWEERFRQFWNAELASQSDLCDYCFEIWRKFFLGETRSGDQGAFRTAVEQLRVIATALPT